MRTSTDDPLRGLRRRRLRPAGGEAPSGSLGGRARRLAVAGVLLAGWLLLPASPAAANHDSYEAGSVVLNDRVGRDDSVVVVFPLGTDENAVREQVLAHAAARGVEVRDVRVAENTSPDTVRAFVVTDLSERTGFLTGRVPASRVEAWRGLAGRGEVHLSLNRWARVEGAVAERSGDYLLRDPRDVSYRLSAWVLLAPLGVLLAAGALPYLMVRAMAERVVRGDGTAEDRLHRIRRVIVVVQVVAPLALVTAMFATRTMDWVQVLLTEVAPGLRVPRQLGPLLGLLGIFTPLLLALATSSAAFVPYDRRLRDTRQSTRAGLGQALRAIGLVLVPVLLWQVVLVFLPPLGAAALLPVTALFGLGFAALAPVLMNAVLTTAPLDPALRERVLRVCADQGLRVRDARLLDTRGGKVANAAISGVLPNLRYVFLTDRLVEILDEDELDAVLAHEIAHGKGHHLLAKLGATLAVLVALVGLLAVGAQPLLRGLSGTVGLVAVALVLPIALLVVLLLVQGVLGVALEKRADDRAVRTVGARPLSRGLEKVAEANRMKRRTGWLWNVLQQHPGLEERIRRLEETARRPDADGGAPAADVRCSAVGGSAAASPDR